MKGKNNRKTNISNMWSCKNMQRYSLFYPRKFLPKS